jgi:hypothetical protein
VGKRDLEIPTLYIASAGAAGRQTFGGMHRGDRLDVAIKVAKLVLENFGDDELR